MQIEIKSDTSWNDKRLTLVEEPNVMGDLIHICIHGEHDYATIGETVKVYKSDFIRAAKMFAVEYETEPQ